MTYSEFVQLYFERSNALQNYWTLYVVVIGGLLAFSSFRKIRDFRTTFLVSILFASFAYKNLGAIREASVQRFAALEASRQTVQPADPATSVRGILEPTMQPPGLMGVSLFHVVCCLLTIATLWSMEFRRDWGPSDDRAYKEIGRGL